MYYKSVILVAWLGLYATPLDAGPVSTVVRESAEFVIKKFSKEVGEESVEVFSRKLGTLAARHGDDAVLAVRKVGPRAVRILEELGEHGGQAAKLLAQHGDDAVWLVSRPGSLSLVTQYGDEAAECLIKHGEIAEPLVRQLGKPATLALKNLSPRNGRRLAMLSQQGTLQSLGKTEQLLGVVERFGDRGMEFIWRNKGALATGTALTAFLLNPKPFVDGSVQIGQSVTEHAIAPLATAPAQMAVEAARNTNWTWVATLAILTGFGWAVSFRQRCTVR